MNNYLPPENCTELETFRKAAIILRILSFYYIQVGRTFLILLMPKVTESGNVR